MLKKKADINLALAIAANLNDVNLADFLIGKGASIDTALFIAADETLEIGFNFLINKGANVDIALCFAAKINDINALNFLIRKGANVNTKDKNGRGRTPLHYAALTNNVHIIEVLIRNGANVNAADENGYTPLHNAAFIGNKDVFNLLLSNNASVNARDILGRTASTLAAKRGHVDIVNLIVISRCTEVNAKDKNDHTSTPFIDNKSIEMPCIKDHAKPQSNHATCAITCLLVSIASAVLLTLTSSFIFNISVACLLIVTLIGAGLHCYKASQYQQMSNKISSENQLNQISLEQQGQQRSLYGSNNV